MPRVKRYDLLAPSLRTLKAARPIARWQVMTLAVVTGLIGAFALVGRVDRLYSSGIFYVYLLLLLLLYFLPQRLYGTTIEMLEGKVLRVVEEMEKILIADDLEFSEAAFFQVKENLQAARHELRQQIDLAHRRWR
ncbi:MAG: hypothetical protein HC802_03455 [Caldilineaceae bacterium]|nr:hypothetical protein [Caldilineaceae bacterium]